MERINFRSGGQRIDGTIVTPAKRLLKNPGVIFFHGMTSNETGYIPIAERLAQKGISAMTLSIRGHGLSEGDFNSLTVADAVADGKAAYDFFADYSYIDRERIGIGGASVGAAISTMVAAEREVKSLVLRAPATYTDEMMQMTYSQIMAEEGKIFRKISNITNTPAVKAVREFRGSLLIITSQNDSVIPVAIPTEYLLQATMAKKKELKEIKGAAHQLTEDKRKEFIDEVIKWFVETL